MLSKCDQYTHTGNINGENHRALNQFLSEFADIKRLRGCFFQSRNNAIFCSIEAFSVRKRNHFDKIKKRVMTAEYIITTRFSVTRVTFQRLRKQSKFHVRIFMEFYSVFTLSGRQCLFKLPKAIIQPDVFIYKCMYLLQWHMTSVKQYSHLY